MKEQKTKLEQEGCTATINMEKHTNKDARIPYYYIGSNGYEARKVVEGFGLSYNIGTATTYLLRANRKHATPVQDIKKAIAHLEFELELIKNKS
tara:strand:+ start:1739 stop:2020 length:282 start_codon:yes stop_codon:yes gene_type:complete